MVKALLTVKLHLCCFLNTHHLKSSFWQPEALSLSLSLIMLSVSSCKNVNLIQEVEGGGWGEGVFEEWSNPKGKISFTDADTFWHMDMDVSMCILSVFIHIVALAQLLFVPLWFEKKKIHNHVPGWVFTCVLWECFTSPHLWVCVRSCWPPAILADGTSSWSNMFLLALSDSHTEKCVCPYQSSLMPQSFNFPSIYHLIFGNYSACLLVFSISCC